MSGVCTQMNCLKPTEGKAMICDDHRAERIAECKQRAKSPNFKPSNPMCNFGYHATVLICGCLTKTFTGGKCEPCDKCHYCGEVHPHQVAA